MQNFAIGIPTLNRADLLLPSLNKYLLDFKGIDIYIIDNGQQNISLSHPNIHIYEQEHNIGVAASWNKLCKIVFKKHDYILLLNDDVYLGYGTECVNDAIQKYPNKIVQSFISWSVILLSKYMYNYIGDFDETFYPAYYEDSDYLYRMKIKGLMQEVEQKLNINSSLTN
jgi:GT2 family glycosyltransferase